MPSPELRTDDHSTSTGGGRGPLAALADYLAERRATRLVVDGAVLHVLCALVGHLWAANSTRLLGATPPTSPFEYLVSPSTILQAVWGLLFYLAWALVGVGCARIVADAVRGRGA